MVLSYAFNVVCTGPNRPKEAGGNKYLTVLHSPKAAATVDGPVVFSRSHLLVANTGIVLATSRGEAPEVIQQYSQTSLQVQRRPFSSLSKWEGQRKDEEGHTSSNSCF